VRRQADRDSPDWTQYRPTATAYPGRCGTSGDHSVGSQAIIDLQRFAHKPRNWVISNAFTHLEGAISNGSGGSPIPRTSRDTTAVRVATVFGLWNPIGDTTFATQPFLESAKPRLNKERPIGRSSDGDPRRHTQKMQKRLHATIDHLREVVDKVDDRQLKAMFRGTRRAEEGLWRLRTEERKPVARVI
jgi:hypothetical protein